MRLLLKTLVASAFLQYTTTAIAIPWEVGKLLLQVQWVPRDAGEMDDEEPVVEEVVEEMVSCIPSIRTMSEAHTPKSSDESGEESYFADPSNPNSSTTARYSAQRPVDERGYVIRSSVLEDSTRPDYIIPVGSADGVWSMIKKVGRFRGEGWLSLWKGVPSSTVQPGLL